MFLWFGTKKDVQKKPGGRRERVTCPECHAVANFVECEATESLTAFTVELLSDVETVFRCSRCGDLFKLDSVQQPTTGGDAAKSRSASVEDLAEQRKRREKNAEKELAALKRKMKQ